MSIRTLKDPKPSFASSARRWERRLVLYDPRFFVMSPALIRFARGSVGELLGYRLAGLMGAPVLPHVGFWSPDPVRLPRAMSKPGRIGIALDWKRPVMRIPGGWCCRSWQHPDIVAKALALSLFSRDHYIEMALAGRDLIAFDLSSLFPDFNPSRRGSSWVSALRDMTGEFQRYARQDRSGLNSILRDVVSFNLEEPFYDVVSGLAETPLSKMVASFDLDPHPLATDMAFLAAEAVHLRVARACMAMS